MEKKTEGSAKDDHSPAYESRLKVLEQQLAQLLKKSEEVGWSPWCKCVMIGLFEAALIIACDLAPHPSLHACVGAYWFACPPDG